MIDVSELIRDPDFTVSAVVRRVKTSELNHGRIQTETEDTEITAVIQPATAEELTALNGLNVAKNTEVLSIYTLEPLNMGREQRPDIFIYRGQEYELISVEFFKDIGNYYHALASRKIK